MESKVAHDAIVNDPFPFRRVASLEKLINFWSARTDSDSESTRTIAKEVIRRLAEVPALMAPEVSMTDLKSHPELLDLLMTAVFPPARLQTTIASAFPPFELQPFYATVPFEKLKIMERFLLHNHIYGFKIGMEDMFRGKALSAYHKIAEELYGVKIGHGFPFVITLPDKETGLNKYYRVIIDPSFITLKTPNGVPELSETDRRRLVAEPHNLELWLELLDPDYFEIHGFVVMNAVDVTEQEILSQLKNQLLLKDALTGEDNLNRVERLLQELFDRPKIRLGLIALDRCRSGQVSGARAIGRSLLLCDELPACERWEDSLYASVLTTGERVFVNDLNEVENNTAFEHQLKEQGFRNLFLAPLQFRDMPLGVFELGSPDCCDINANHGALLYEVTALLSTAISRSLEEQEDRVQALIKKQYTAIHPVVEWRFREAALNRITATAPSDKPIENIVFDGVYPLYGMSDIRGSSDYRSSAIQDDLKTQLGLALAVIVEASAVRPRPSLDELGYRLSRHIEDLVSGTRDGDEHSLILLLQTEVEPLFERFKALSPSVGDRVDEYMRSLDPDLGVVYEKRKAFEESVTRLNEAISLFLDRQQEQAQSMVEHYYEKYQTDGVEYNIYAGSSLLEKGQFDELDLKNLKLWQLTTMAGVVWEMKRIQPSLRIPLETAHLILVQSVPLSIRFRIDEKKFDVDGAYNIRYEIVKKRIDKAQIAGTSERLTQPGMIAIVYSQESEAAEYIQYLEYLQAAGYLEPGIERVELERLQGVHGLKALRVSVSERNPAVDFEKEESESGSTALQNQVAEQSDASV